MKWSWKSFVVTIWWTKGSFLCSNPYTFINWVLNRLWANIIHKAISWTLMKYTWPGYGCVKIHLVGLRLCCMVYLHCNKINDKTQKICLQYFRHGVLKKMESLIQKQYRPIVFLTWTIGMHNGSPFWCTQSYTSIILVTANPLKRTVQVWAEFSSSLTSPEVMNLVSFCGLGSLKGFLFARMDLQCLISMQRRQQEYWILLKKMKLADELVGILNS